MGLLILRSGASSAQSPPDPDPPDPPEWDGKTAHYVRQGASGDGSGNDWTNAYTNLPSSLSRDHVYYVADGSYGNQTLDDAVSTTLRIYIVKATVDDHGTETGWDSAYGDGAATWGHITVDTGYHTFHGQTRTETTRMEAPAGYGFRVTGELRATSIDGNDASNSLFAYIDCGGTWSEAAWSETVCSYNSQCLYFVFNQHDITFERCCFHNAGHNGALAMMHGSDDIIFDHCDFYFGWGKACIASPNSGQDGHITRYCRFWNAAQRDFCEDVEGGGITTELGTYSYSGDTTGNEVYGCVFYSTAIGGRNAVIQYGETSPGPNAVNCKVFNNTIVGMEEDSVVGEIVLFGGSGNEARNNLFHDCVATTVTASTSSNNVTEVSDPFVDYANRDFRLAAPIGGGIDLGSPYNVDPLGNSRGTSGVDVGAYAST